MVLEGAVAEQVLQDLPASNLTLAPPENQTDRKGLENIAEVAQMFEEGSVNTSDSFSLVNWNSDIEC